MIYYVYFDSYGHARQVIIERELAQKYKNDKTEFFEKMCNSGQATGRGHSVGHVGTLRFENEKELNDYLKSLGDEIDGFYGCGSESRPYNF